jgi:hypothetical protein
MPSRTLTTTAAAIALIVFGGAATAHAQVARFSRINDAVPLKFFDAATTKPDPANPNRLIIGLNTGFDPQTFVSNEFKASGLAFSSRVAMDTISFKVKAPAGFYVAKIVYTQRGTGSTLRTSVSRGAANWVVNGVSANLGTFTSNPGLVGMVDLTGLKLTSVPVSITDSLFATTGTVEITSADVVVTLKPLIP